MRNKTRIVCIGVIIMIVLAEMGIMAARDKPKKSKKSPSETESPTGTDPGNDGSQVKAAGTEKKTDELPAEAGGDTSGPGANPETDETETSATDSADTGVGSSVSDGSNGKTNGAEAGTEEKHDETDSAEDEDDKSHANTGGDSLGPDIEPVNEVADEKEELKKESTAEVHRTDDTDSDKGIDDQDGVLNEDKVDGKQINTEAKSDDVEEEKREAELPQDHEPEKEGQKEETNEDKENNPDGEEAGGIGNIDDDDAYEFGSGEDVDNDAFDFQVNADDEDGSGSGGGDDDEWLTGGNVDNDGKDKTHITDVTDTLRKKNFSGMKICDALQSAYRDVEKSLQEMSHNCICSADKIDLFLHLKRLQTEYVEYCTLNQKHAMIEMIQIVQSMDKILCNMTEEEPHCFATIFAAMDNFVFKIAIPEYTSLDINDSQEQSIQDGSGDNGIDENTNPMDDEEVFGSGNVHKDTDTSKEMGNEHDENEDLFEKKEKAFTALELANDKAKEALQRAENLRSYEEFARSEVATAAILDPDKQPEKEILHYEAELAAVAAEEEANIAEKASEEAYQKYQEALEEYNEYMFN